MSVMAIFRQEGFRRSNSGIRLCLWSKYKNNEGKHCGYVRSKRTPSRVEFFAHFTASPCLRPGSHLRGSRARPLTLPSEDEQHRERVCGEFAPGAGGEFFFARRRIQAQKHALGDQFARLRI